MRAWWAARRLRTKILLGVVAFFVALGIISPKSPTASVASATASPTGSAAVTASDAAPAATMLVTPAAATSAPPAIATTAAPTTAPTPGAATSQCHSVNNLPDRSCTPGVADPRVTQANIASTICVSGYTTTVRPPTSYTDPLKVQQMALYGETGSTANYEEDHLIALEIGGDPRDPKNLWPEPRTSIGGAAEQKDTLENRLHSQVCAGTITLAAAQDCISVDWVACLSGAAAATPAPTTAPVPTPAPSVAPTQAGATTQIVSVTSPIARNANATVRAQTAAGASCTIVVRYSSGPSSAQGLGAKAADGSGAVAWTWTIGPNTTLGTWPITVTCGGASASSSITVQ